MNSKDVVPLIAGASNPVWSPDGTRLAFILRQPTALATASADGGNLQILLRGEGTYAGLWAPAWSPDSQQLAVIRSMGGISGEIWLVPASGGPPRRLSNDPPGVSSHHPAFTPDGHSLIYSSNRGGATNLWLMPLEGGRPLTQLTTGPGPDKSPSIARDGKILFLISHERAALLVYDLSKRHTRELLTHSAPLWGPAFSPDGREVAFSRGETDGSWHIWIVSAEGGTPRRVTSGALPEIYPRFTPDGNAVIYFTWSPQPGRIWRVPRNGGPAVALTPPQEDDAYPDLSSDGRWLAFARTEGGTTRIYIAPMNGSEARLLTKSPSTSPRWSPNGQWIAFSADRDLRSGVFVIAADGTRERRITPTGSWPVWWPDGKRIGYIAIGPDGYQQIRIVPFEGGPSTPLSGLRFTETNNLFDVSSNGALLVTSKGILFSTEIWLLELQR